MKQLSRARGRTFAVLVVSTALVAPVAARAADLAAAVPLGPMPWTPPAAALLDPADRLDLRFGVFAHGIGGREQGTVDINGEVVTPRLAPGVTGWWSYFIPRVHFGASGNLSGRTSFAYTGVIWTFPVFSRFFIEPYVGPAVHNGSLYPTRTLAGLGCPVLFHAGANAGYRFDEHWSVMLTFEHLSNGKSLFGINCGTNQGPNGSNQGLNNYGVRVGYAF